MLAYFAALPRIAGGKLGASESERSAASTPMFSTSRLSETPSGTPTPAMRGGNTHGAAFQAALADALGVREAGAVGPAGASRHVVTAGETLYGIARARLAAAGQAATPGASMRHAIEIAKANDIRNPDRILAGQRLVLGPMAPPSQSKLDAASASAKGVASMERIARGDDLGDGMELRVGDELAAHSEMPAVDPPQEVSEAACDAPGCRPAIPELPAPGGVAVREGSRGEVDSVASVRADLSLYKQSAPEPPSKPPVELPDIVYKGVVGKALDWVPLDPSTRTGLQQANAVVSSSIVARSIAAATGIGGPILTIAGLVWGIFSARKISAMQAQANEPKPVAQRDLTARLTE